MSEHWKDILPIDRYIVHSKSVMEDYDRTVLTLLYQPLIGSLCYSLYMTLWGELKRDQFFSEEKSHHFLMAIMQSNLRDLYDERKKLEGIGLLKTFVEKKENDVRTFVYELQPPLHPGQFFDDGVLNIYLYNRLGKKHFHKLKDFFSVKKLDKVNYTPITKSFHEVFVSLHPSELTAENNSEVAQDLNQEVGKAYVSKTNASAISIETDFNFELLETGLTDMMLTKETLTPAVKETLSKLAFVYRIDPLNMRDIVIRSYDTATEQIDIEELRKSARDWYQFEHSEGLPSLSLRAQPLPHRVMTNIDPHSKEEELMKKLEIVSPFQLLKNIAGGAEPTLTDLQMIEEVMFKQKLSPGVVNVLIYYVMLKSDMKLSKSYVAKIAAHWSRKQVKTVPEAMRLAKAEHRSYQEWASKPKRKTIREEVLPDWLKKQQADANKKESGHGQAAEDEKLKFEELIKQFKDE